VDTPVLVDRVQGFFVLFLAPGPSVMHGLKQSMRGHVDYCSYGVAWHPSDLEKLCFIKLSTVVHVKEIKRRIKCGLPLAIDSRLH